MGQLREATGECLEGKREKRKKMPTQLQTGKTSRICAFHEFDLKGSLPKALVVLMTLEPQHNSEFVCWSEGNPQ